MKRHMLDIGGTGMKKGTAIRVMLAVAVFGLAVWYGCSSDAGSKDSVAPVEEPVPVKVQPVEPQVFEVYGSYYGNLEGITDATIVTYLGGRIDKVLAKEGSWVKAGTSLCRIDGGKADAMLEMAKLNEKIAREAFERTQKLFGDGTASQVNLDQVKLGWLKAQNARLDAEKGWRGQMGISPINGVVLSRFIKENQEVPPGTPTFTVADVRRLTVQIGIPEGDLVGVAEGNPAQISVDQYPDRQWVGKVTRLSREIQEHSRVASAELTIDNADKVLRPGMTVKVNLLRRRIDACIVVPSGAVLSGAQGPFVAIASGDTARIRPVVLGPSSATQTVIESGLNGGEQLVIAGQHQVADGAPIIVRSN